MSAAVELLATFRAQGYLFTLAADRVKVQPASALAPEDLAALKAHRDELAQLLREEAEGTRPVGEAPISIVPAEAFVAELQAEGKLPAADPKQPELTPRWQLAGPPANPPIRKAVSPPLACLAGIPVEDMTPAEHWEVIGGSAVVAPLSKPADYRLRLAVLMAARDGPGSSGERDYQTFWRKFTTGETA